MSSQLSFTTLMSISPLRLSRVTDGCGSTMERQNTPTRTLEHDGSINDLSFDM